MNSRFKLILIAFVAASLAIAVGALAWRWREAGDIAALKLASLSTAATAACSATAITMATTATLQIIPKSSMPRDSFSRLPTPVPVASHSAIITPRKARGAASRAAAQR